MSCLVFSHRQLYNNSNIQTKQTNIYIKYIKLGTQPCLLLSLSIPHLPPLLFPKFLSYPSPSFSSPSFFFPLFWLSVRETLSPLNSYTGTLQRSNLLLLAMKYLPHRGDIFIQCQSRRMYKGARWKTMGIWKEHLKADAWSFLPWDSNETWLLC